MASEEELFTYIRRIDIRQLEGRLGKHLLTIIYHNASAVHSNNCIDEKEKSFKIRAIKFFCKLLDLKYHPAPKNETIEYKNIEKLAETMEGTGWTLTDYHNELIESIKRMEAYNKKFERRASGVHYLCLFLVLLLSVSLNIFSVPLYVIIPASLVIGYFGGYLARIISKNYSDRISNDVKEFYK